jgi:hypothetical protein
MPGPTQSNDAAAQREAMSGASPNISSAASAPNQDLTLVDYSTHCSHCL